eukprot:CAMPEP_0202872374 /NCGR_PEP_ID=MMETSP1391-20130828/21058_1 /ASSEMBLY_ACC=CAM_ASM_000867 /TAXON_ID=1034604 /ORGANISM="Chlamydomonas leiostraca, Strain SAG 11-49" /LENGTH=88 /DNA_ID=CAMNT_0049553401 /DNA_START=21 /DNA_END=284 /DNA_ORIENTATION=-
MIFSNPASNKHDDHGRSKRLYDMVVTEAAIAHTMSHPNIVATYRYEFKALATGPAEIAAVQEGGASPRAGQGNVGGLEVDMGAAMAGQ